MQALIKLESPTGEPVFVAFGHIQVIHPRGTGSVIKLTNGDSIDVSLSAEEIAKKAFAMVDDFHSPHPRA